jgi:hypothetical protein
MKSFLSRAACILWALSALAAGPANTIGPSGDTLTVHEWGTFTSVAGEAGYPLTWQPLAGATDLPCFVNRLPGRSLKTSAALVRMETPVLYFYSPRPASVSVQVRFPQGQITEWYPRASSVQPIDGRGSVIEWASIDVLPGTHPELPVEKAASHYYAARETDSAPLRIGGQHEKLIFYRGIGSFQIPLRTAFTGEGRLALRNTGSEPIPEAILFENRAGRVAYRRLGPIEREVTVEMPALTGDVDGLRRQMEDVLIARGLYPKEARAMVETWRDSWFEEGTRVFYILPRSTVDRVLPLAVNPSTTATERVFVGRVELLSPWMREEIVQTLTTGNVDSLGKYGRFLQPYLEELRRAHPDLVNSSRLRAFLNAAYSRVQSEFDGPCR